MTDMIWSSYNSNEYDRNISDKYILNLCCVNSFTAGKATTQENPPENCVALTSTQNIPEYTRARALLVDMGLTRSCTLHIINRSRLNKTHTFSFGMDSHC